MPAPASNTAHRLRWGSTVYVVAPLNCLIDSGEANVDWLSAWNWYVTALVTRFQVKVGVVLVGKLLPEKRHRTGSKEIW